MTTNPSITPEAAAAASMGKGTTSADKPSEFWQGSAQTPSEHACGVDQDKLIKCYRYSEDKPKSEFPYHSVAPRERRRLPEHAKPRYPNRLTQLFAAECTGPDYVPREPPDTGLCVFPCKRCEELHFLCECGEGSTEEDPEFSDCYRTVWVWPSARDSWM